MIEYVLIAALLVMAYMVLQNRSLNNKKWFLYLKLAFIVAAIVFLVMDNPAPLTFQKIVIVMLILSGVIHTYLKRIVSLRQPPKGPRVARKS